MRFYYLSLILLILLFLFLRFYSIQDSLFFQNDIGRDFLILYEFLKEGKVPLLGPQNSALPFNQSALYFYYLFPFFAISNMSFFSTLVANAVLYILSFIVSFFLVKEKSERLVVLTVIFLIIIHPEIIKQNRYVWNPSFIPPLILISGSCLMVLLKKFEWRTYFLLWLSATVALSMNYSFLPVYLSLFAVCLVKFKGKVHFTLLFILFSLFVNFLPSILFEIKHNFLLSQMLFKNTILTGSESNWLVNVGGLLRYILPSNISFIPLIFIVLVGYYLWKILRNEGLDLNERIFLKITIISFLITLLAPFPIRSHYIFGLLILVFFLIAYLPNKIKIIFSIILSIVWINPVYLNQYFDPAPRTVRELDSCFKNICEYEKEPMLVAVQASYHNYHFGPEFRFLMKKNKCSIPSVELAERDVKKMALILDQAGFEPGKTNFMELNNFGDYTVDKDYTCEGGVKAVILKRV